MSRPLAIVIAVVISLAVVGGGFFAWKSLSKPPEEKEAEMEKEGLKELSLDQRPYATLTPGPSCEYTLALARIQTKPEKIEYEIVYRDEKGVTQGASGTLKVTGRESISKDVLFGTESSGHRKCDKGVEEGSITLRYRNGEGKLIAKLETDFVIVEGGKMVKLGDNLTVTLGKPSTSKLLAMGTVGLPEKAPGQIAQGPFGVFTSGKANVDARIEFDGSGKLHGWNGTKWAELEGDKASFLGTYILVK